MFTRNPSWAYDFCMLENNQTVVYACGDATLRLFCLDREDEEPLSFVQNLHVHSSMIGSICTLSPAVFCTGGGNDGSFGIWNLSSTHQMFSVQSFQFDFKLNGMIANHRDEIIVWVT